MARNGFRQPQLTLHNAVFYKLLVAVIFSAISACTESASALYPLEKFPNYIGIRGLGMGGAQINAVNDETSILINPAALGKLRNTYATLLDPELSVNELASRSATNSNLFDDPQALLEFMNRNPNKYYYARAQIMPSMVLRNFGIGVFGIDARASYVDDTTNKYSLSWRRDTGFVLAYNIRFWEGRIKIGASARVLNRIEIDSADFDTTSTGLSLRSIAAEGGAVGADAGIILSAPIRYLPSISAVVRDVGHTDFTVGKGYFFDVSARPTTQRQSIDAGFAFFPILSNSMRMTVTGEYRNVMSQDENDKADALRRVHVGAEVNMSDVLFFRAGMHQRYWTGGLEIASEHFQIQGASYGQEIGTPGAPREDRRWVGKIVFRY